MKDFKEFRCFGKNKRNKVCNSLLFKYEIKEDEMIVSIKCPSCNTFSILHLPFKKSENHDTKK